MLKQFWVLEMHFWFSLRITLLVILISPKVYSQNLHTISLQKYSIDNSKLDFKIKGIIDAREDKNILGVIQRGLKNKKDIAVFKTRGLNEIIDLFKRSRLMSENNSTAIVLRINTLRITEISRALQETAKAEVSIDFFMHNFDNSYEYISSEYSTYEPSGIDVTNYHDENIVHVLELALTRFNPKKNATGKVATYDELVDPKYSLINTQQLPILNDKMYAEGYYVSFNEFIGNSPSINIECSLRFEGGIKVKCKGEKTEAVNSIYGFSKDNELYILFHHDFYLIEREEDVLYFKGPKLFGNGAREDMAKGWAIGGFAGAAISSRSKGYKDIYVINLSNGSIENVTGF